MSSRSLPADSHAIRAAGNALQIDVSNLGKRFNREWIFRNLTTTFTPGNIYAITGPNGSGKSTLLQVLWGQMPPSVGTLSYQYNQQSLPIEDAYAHVAVATPYMDLIDEFTLAEQVRFHFTLRAPREGVRVDEVIERMELAHARDKIIANFSSGMRQRLKLGLAFFTRAAAVFLDEPGTNLDGKAFDWYLRQLAALPPGVLVIIASNQAAEYPENSFKIEITSYK